MTRKIDSRASVAFRYRPASPAPTPSRQWQIGGIIAGLRTKRCISEHELSNRTKQNDPTGTGLTTARIREIEQNTTIPDLREIHLLGTALQVSARDIVQPDPHPWFAIRRRKAEELLTQVKGGEHPFYRTRGAHEYLIEERNIYHYVPLDDTDLLVDSHEREGSLYPTMRKSLFEVGPATDEEILKGLDRHHGEEIIMVLEGELEFCFRQHETEELKKILLYKQDCIQYSSQLYHSYRATGEKGYARALFVFVGSQSDTPPQFLPDRKL